ncbi:hypothetical protein BH18ACI2_BH18ACI2_22610 [soil metagenome]
MLKKSSAVIAIVLTRAVSALAQNTNRSPPAPTPTPAPTETAPATEADKPATRARRAPAATPATTTARATQAASPAARAVRGVFETLLDGIREADVEEVMSVYWNSPQLLIFNNNGTVTKSWEQVKANRASLYPNVKNVEVEVRDVRVQMNGRDTAIVTALWRQAQDYKGTPETSTGRMTLVFRLINNGWKVVHTHTSPEAPDPSRLPPSDKREPETPPPAKPE